MSPPSRVMVDQDSSFQKPSYIASPPLETWTSEDNRPCFFDKDGEYSYLPTPYSPPLDFGPLPDSQTELCSTSCASFGYFDFPHVSDHGDSMLPMQSPQGFSPLPLGHGSSHASSALDFDFMDRDVFSDSPNARPERKDRWSCGHEECLESFATSKLLEDHAIAKNHRTYVCKQCKKDFKRRDTYVRHVATHRNPRQYPCEICDQGSTKMVFKRKAHLMHHQRSRHNTAFCRSCLSVQAEYITLLQPMEC